LISKPDFRATGKLFLPNPIVRFVNEIRVDRLINASGVKLTQPTEQQADHLAVPVKGRCQPEHYRY